MSSVRPTILVNERAGRGWGRARRLRQLESLVQGRAAVQVTADLRALERVCAILAAQGVDEVALLGGDGTVSRSLSALVAAYGPSELPRIALLGGGTMNTLARSVGTRTGPLRAVRRWLDHVSGDDPCDIVEHATLQIDGDRVGMLFGTGLFARYIIDYDAGAGGPLGAALVLARAVVSALVGGPYVQRLTARTAAVVEVDGERMAEGDWLVAAAGVIPAVGLGFRPFAACRDDPGGFAFLVIGCSPAALAVRMHRAFLGLPLDHPQIVEGVARRVRLIAQNQGPYMMDGDVSETGPVTTIAAGPRLRLIRLDAQAQASTRAR